MTSMSLPGKRKKKMMPNMHGAAIQCCMCVVGVFMFLGGLIMLSTGICLILNYGVFDVTLLPPDLQNEEGKKTVGIILTSCGLLAVSISVIVSLLFLCNKNKSSAINPDELSRIPSSARNGTPDKPDRRRSTGANKTHPVANGTSRGNVSSRSNGTKLPPVKNIPGSTEVKHPRPYKKGGKHRKYPRRRLEEIKEQDAISRKTMEGAIHNDYSDSPRSGSFSSEMTLDDPKIPKVVLGDFDENRAPSVDSASTSHSSEISNYRYLENDKSRRELQFLPDSIPSKDNSTHDDNYSKDSNYTDRDDNSVNGYGKNDSEVLSINSENTQTKKHTSDVEFFKFSDKFSAGGNAQLNTSRDNIQDVSATSPTSLPGAPDSDESIVSYKAFHKSEFRGENTSGRVSPQVGELETAIEIEAKANGYGMKDESV